mgnify:FL=1
MKAVVLAAGESSRFWPFNQKHKSLFQIMSKPLIWYTLEGLGKSGIKDIIVVQGPEKIVEKELKNYKTKLKINYVAQAEPNGTGNALLQAKDLIKGPFVVIGAHKIDCGEYLPLLLKKSRQTPQKIVFLGVRTSRPQDFGILKFQDNKILEIVENPPEGKEPSDIKSTEAYVFPNNFFDYLKRVTEREQSLIDAANLFIKENGAEFVLLKEGTISLKYPWDLLDVNDYSLKNIRTAIRGKVEKNCVISGAVVVERGSLVKSGAYIEGPVYIGRNCYIGPNCHIRNSTSIGDNCRIGNGAEIKNSIVGDNSKIPHLSFVGDSIIGDNCNLAAGTIAANFRFDKKTVKSVVKGQIIDTQKDKFGCAIGDNTQTGVNVSLMPGVIIGSNCAIGPNSLVIRNIEDDTVFYTKHMEVVKKRS